MTQSRNIKELQNWLEMSPREMSVHILPAHRTTQAHISRYMVLNWRKHSARYPMAASQVEDVRVLIVTRLRKDLRRRDLDVTVRVTPRNWWTVRVIAKCIECGRSFELNRSHTKRCSRCITKSKR